MSLTLQDTLSSQSTLGVTVNDAISFVEEALEDPLNPRWCAPSIMACLVVIQPDPNKNDSDVLQTLIRRNHLFGSTIVAFLTAERSIAAIEALASRWSKCSCSNADIADHGTAMLIHHIVVGMMPFLSSDHPRFYNDALQSVVQNFVGLFESAVREVKPFSIAKGRHPEIWPPTPQTIIPYGPETTIESLVTWSRFFGGARVFSLVHLFVHICGPVIIPAIIASRSAPNYMIEHGLQICTDISNAPLNRNRQVEDYTAEIFIHELGYTASFIQSLNHLPPLLFRDCHFGYAQRILDFVTRVLVIIKSPIFPESYKPWLDPWTGRLARYAAMVYTSLAEQLTTPKARVHPAIRTEMDRMATPSPPADFACEMMRHARSLQFCFAPGCPESAQSSGHVYKRCSGCRVVAYCGQSCQKRAWTYQHHPHKDICKKMKQVYDIGGDYLHREADQDKFVREMKKAKVKDVMLKEIGLWVSRAYMTLQRKGPLLTPAVRQYLSQKEGPLYPKGAEKHISDVESSLFANPKRRHKAKR